MFSQTIEYALRAVVWLASKPGCPQTNQQIARATKVPAGYLAKVLQGLNHAGLTEARRGIGGGFSLNRDARHLTVLDVVNAVDPLQRIRRCPLRLVSHGMNLCPLHRRMDSAVAAIEDAFARTSIHDILTEPTGSPPLCEAKFKA